MLRIKHHSQGNGSQHRRHRYHHRQGNHAPGKIPGRVLHLVHIGRNLLTAAYGEDQDGQPHEEAGVKRRHEGPGGPPDFHKIALCQSRSSQHHRHKQHGHKKHGRACRSGQPLQHSYSPARQIEGGEENHQTYDLEKGGIHGAGPVVLKNGPAGGNHRRGGLLGNVGHMDHPVGPPCVVGHFGADGFVNPGADSAARVPEG